MASIANACWKRRRSTCQPSRRRCAASDIRDWEVPYAPPDFRLLPSQQIALDGSQMRQHGLAGAFGVAPQQRIENRLVLAAIDAAAFLGKRALLHFEPWRLIAQDAHQIVDLLEEVVARAGEDAVMELRIPMLEGRHIL